MKCSQINHRWKSALQRLEFVIVPSSLTNQLEGSKTTWTNQYTVWRLIEVSLIIIGVFLVFDKFCRKMRDFNGTKQFEFINLTKWVEDFENGENSKWSARKQHFAVDTV